MIASFALFLLQSGFWASIPPMPTARQEVGVAAVEGRVYVAGGLDASGTGRNTLEIFDTRTGQWETGPSRAVYAPGAWVYRETRYAWRPGFWYVHRPGWIYTPAHYAWTPYGYVFVDAYWDYPLRQCSNWTSIE